MLTVIFATRNGARTLPRMLNSLVQLDYDAPWEVIAIDNDSSDDTLKILKQHESCLPLTIMQQPKPGKNQALNLGIPNAKGSLIVLTDDDVIVNPDWLKKLEECAEQHPDFDIFGGRILPHWDDSPDPIVLQNAPLGVTYALTPIDQEDGPIFPGLIWGANMAIRKSVFDAGHRFNTKIGPTKSDYIMGSETEFTIRIHNAGHQSWFCDDAQVRHIIRHEQLTQSWVIGRAYRFGRGQWVQDLEKGFNVPRIGNIPRWRIRALANEYIRKMVAYVKNDRNNLFKSRWEISFLKGYFYQAFNGIRKAQEK